MVYLGLNKKEIEKVVNKKLKGIKKFSRSHCTASKKNIFSLANDLCAKFEQDENLLKNLINSLNVKESDFVEE